MSKIEEEQSEISEREELEYRKLCELFLELEKKGLIIREASYGNTRVEYCRGRDLQEFIKNNLDYLCEEINKICGTKINFNSESAFQLVYNEFNDRNMLLKAEKQEEDAKLKYPIRLIPFEENTCKDEHNHKHHHLTPEQMSLFDPSMCYVVYIERNKKKTYLWLAVCVICVLMFCLFPVWPLDVKIGIWWVSYVILVTMLSIIVLRLIIHFSFYVFGIDVWLFPNLFDDKVTHKFNFLVRSN